MRFSLIVGVALLLTIATSSIVQACKTEQTCGNLGPGTNACKCGEIVVKAAKVQKPLFYASPKAINEAAAAREAIGTEYGTSFPKYKSYASGAAFSSSGSTTSSHSSSSSSSSTSSSVGLLGGLFSSFKPVSGSRVTSSCGCGKTSESLEARDLLSTNIEGKVVPSFPPIGDLCYPNPPRGSKYQVTTKVTPAHPGKIKCGPPIPYEVCVQILNGQIDEAGLKELSLATGDAIGGSVFASANNLGEYTSDVARRRYGDSFRGGYGSVGSAGSTAYGYGSYVEASAGAAAGTGQFRTSDVDTLQGSVSTSHTSSCDFGDDSEFVEDYSYPRLPADPVSLTLAYKNLFPRMGMHYNRRTFVPEDKLAFGHRTVPTESTPGKKVSDVPEEKLQILEKPVVELKPVSSVPTTIGVYDEHEEAKLAELEAIERERINQEELAERRQENLITYGDLGYAPIDRVLPGRSGRPLSAGPIGVFNVENDIGTDCGPIGPPDPDYVPGGIVIDQELVKSEGEIEDDDSRNIGDSEMFVRHYAGDSDEEDDSDDSTSGIFAKLKSVARKHGSPCGAV